MTAGSGLTITGTTITAAGGAGTIDGTGTANELVYWVDTDTVGALTVATYPSLTEISYVKGVTSAIQTQFTGKASTALSNLASVAINTSLVSDTDNTDALGSALIGWSDLFLGSGAVVNFNNGDVTLTHSANTLTIDGGDLALGTNNLTLTGSIASTGSRVTKGWFTDLEVTNVPTINGTSLNSTYARLGAANAFSVGGQTITVANAANVDGLTITQNDTTNSKIALKIVTPVNPVSGYPLVIEATNASNNGAFIQTYHNSASPLAGDCIGGWDIWGNSSTGVARQLCNINGYVTDTTNTAEHSKLSFTVYTAGTSASELELIGTSLYPTTSDGLALGSTTNMWSDLFLASGSVVNFNNGDVTLTHSANLLTLGGGNFSIGTTGVLTAGTIELGAASDTTLSRVSAGVIAVEGKTILTTDGGTLTGNITLGENTAIALDPAGSADGKYSGITVAGTAGEALAFGDVVVLDVTAGKWFKGSVSAAAGADGDLRGGTGMCVLAAAGDASATVVLLMGTCRADANFPALTIGSVVYASTTGDITVTQPSTTDHIIKVLGYALTADEIMFCPSMDYITHT